MKIARLLCLVAVAALTGAALITIRASAQTAAPNTPAVKEVRAEQFVAEQALKTANLSLEAAKKLMEKGITTSEQVEAVQAQVNRALAQYESIGAKLKALSSAAPAKATTTTLEPEVEFKTELRERRYVIQKPVRQPDGSTKIELEEVIEQVPVTVPVTPVIAEREVGTPDGKVVRTTTQAAPAVAYSGTANAYLRPSYTPAHGHPDQPDEESQKLFDDEKKAATEASKLQADLRKAKSEQQRVEIRAKLREELAEIFDLQQKRRAHEVEAIEERLDKLKETMKKRDAAKNSIVDRRLELVTGGVDELGWEETGAWPLGPANTIRGGYGAYPQPIGVPQMVPPTVPIVPSPPTRARPAKAKAAPAPWPAPAPSVDPFANPQPLSPANVAPSADPAAPAAPAPPAPAAAPALPAPPAVPAPAAAPAAPVAPVPVLPPQLGR